MAKYPKQYREAKKLYGDTPLAWDNTRQQYVPKEILDYESTKRDTYYEDKQDIKGFAYDETPAFYDTIVNLFMGELKQYENGVGASLLYNTMQSIISSNGKEAIGRMLVTASENGTRFEYKIAYSIPLAEQFMSDLLNYLEDQGEIYKEQIMDIMEQNEGAEPWVVE